jgi:murein DD-endopeptidase MepM/ murein hydrolase activator NlpD
MMQGMRILLKLLLLAVGVFVGVWIWAGRSDGPTIDLRGPERFVGQSGMLELMVQAPEGRFARVNVTLEQEGRTHQIFALDQPDQAVVRQDAADRLYIIRPIGKTAIPELQPGEARLVVRAARPVLFGLREVESVATRDVQVRLEPPRVAVLSTFHFVNHGGSEFVVYRATPDDVESGVRVGDKSYSGFPATGVGIHGDPALRVAFFALLFDQDLNTPIHVYARDPAGNETTTPLDHRVIAQQFARSRIQLDDRLLSRIVPAIAASTPEEPIDTTDLLAGFLQINGELRRKNNQYISGLVENTSPELLFRDAFRQLGGSQVEARFADARTYFYQGTEVDRQVHLGFDLAVTANVPITAAQRGVVIHSGYLGIYGNTVVIDHGLGVQSLYAHLSSIDAEVGQLVEKGARIGRSGMTGLAGGDHLHFTMLVGGEQVTPIDWWSPQWLQDRVLRKIAAAGGAG